MINNTDEYLKTIYGYSKKHFENLNLKNYLLRNTAQIYTITNGKISLEISKWSSTCQITHIFAKEYSNNFEKDELGKEWSFGEIWRQNEEHKHAHHIKPAIYFFTITHDWRERLDRFWRNFSPAVNRALKTDLDKSWVQEKLF